MTVGELMKKLATFGRNTKVVIATDFEIKEICDVGIDTRELGGRTVPLVMIEPSTFDR